MLIARHTMDKGRNVLWIDAERTFERRYAALLGIDVDSPLLSVIKTYTLEQTIDAIIMALETKAFALIVVDTWAKLVPTTEAAASLSKDQMGVAPRVNSRATRVWGKALDESGSTLVVLNQERVDLGVYGAPSTSTGGKALMKHEPSIIIFSKKKTGDNLYDNGLPTRLVFRYTLKKSKVFPFAPMVSLADYHQLHVRCSPDAYEIDFPHELYTAARSLGLLVDKLGEPWKKLVAFFEGEALGNGEKQVEAFFRDKSPLRDRIEAAIYLKMQEGQYVITPTAAGTIHEDADGDPGQDEPEAEAELD
jgi:hypothetical protein